MAKASIKITENNIPQVLTQLELVKETILTIIGMKIERYAKALCPVITGNLRNSITYETDGDLLVAGSNLEYSSYVELGTGPYFTPPPSWVEFNTPRGKGVGKHYVHARPYLRPAIENHLSEYRKIIESRLRQT